MEHHAILFVGNKDDAKKVLDASLFTPGLDVIHMDGGRMGIDEVHLLIHEAHLLPLQSSHRTFVLFYESITHDAQNALLKVFEEPPATARFYLVTPHDEFLIPTLRSRLMHMEYTHEGDDEVSQVETFVRLSYADRLAYIATLVKKEDVAGMSTLMNTIEREARAREDVRTLHEVAELQCVFGTPGASRKMILEHLSLSLIRP